MENPRDQLSHIHSLSTSLLRETNPNCGIPSVALFPFFTWLSCLLFAIGALSASLVDDSLLIDASNSKCSFLFLFLCFCFFPILPCLHEYPGDASLLEDMQDLFERFPYWGERLYKVLKEVEDPTPMTWYEKWSDRRKSPRYTYWAGVIALGFALFFGITATILGALQVWISYCSWQGEAVGHSCKFLSSH